jgi:murein DD-endopeptidase MepM/ murein hydrolase activator NlpD
VPKKKSGLPEISSLRVVDRKEADHKNKSPRLSMVRVQKTAKRGNKPSLFLFTLYFLYKNLYVLGVTILRRRRRLMRAARMTFNRCKGTLYAMAFRLSQAIHRFFKGISTRLKAPFLRIRNAYREQKPIIKAKWKKGVFPFASYLEVAEAVFRLFRRIIATIINHLVPVAALLVLLFIVSGFLSQNFGLRVLYKNEEIGYIKSESDFDAATRDVQSRVIAESSYTFSTEVPSFELVICENPGEENPWILFYNGLLKQAGLEMVELEEFTSPTELADTIIQMSGQAVEEGYGLYIDNRFYGAVYEKDGILSFLESIRARGMSGKPGERVEFEKSIDFSKKRLYLARSMVDEQSLIDLLTTPESTEQTYIVQEDDTPTGIAAKTGVSYSLLKEMNPDIEENLMVGDEIKTAVERPFLSVNCIYTDVYEEEVPYDTEEIQNAIYAVGYRNVESAGIPGIREVTAEITTLNGIEVGRVELNSRPVREPVAERVTVGVNVPAVVATPVSPSESARATPVPAGDVTTSGFMWPTSSYRITAVLGGYPGHTGLDIGGSAGLPIYASASGTVTKAKWTYYGYGVHCVINHGNGYTTLYAHMSDMYVSVGTQVTKGQVIGAMGRTGNSTGNHLHFEVRLNNAVKNPLNYISA